MESSKAASHNDDHADTTTPTSPHLPQSDQGQPGGVEERKGGEDSSGQGEEEVGVEEEEEEVRYPREEAMTNLLMKVVSAFEVNKLLNHPILVNLVAEAVLRKNGFDTDLRVGYLWKPDAPTWVHPYVWVETSIAGRTDVTDLVPFPDHSKFIFILGHSISLNPAALKCRYHRTVPENTRVVEENVPPISQIRKAVRDVDDFLHRSEERVRKVYRDIVDNARLPPL